MRSGDDGPETHSFLRADTRHAGRHLSTLSEVDQLLVDHALGSTITPVTHIHVWQAFARNTRIAVERTK